MPDHLFADPGLAALYDRFHPWRASGDLDFYLPMVLAAESVLDVGCGTGMLLHAARRAGHTGRLCGLDPAAGMLERARTRTDIEWLLGDLGSVPFDREFGLVVMSGHAFQVFVTDEELLTSLAAIRSALTAQGRFAFDTRNPGARAWERWTPDHVKEITDASGALVRMWNEVDTPVTGDVVRFTTKVTSPSWSGPQVSRSTLRFLDTGGLSSFLTEAGLVIAEQFGDWAGNPLTASSPEIITVARRA
ncbi:class I SAM-dependent DNA methyltransferase [Amycolatopsis cihanbeyliensis]|uniref:Ubiquinone/menaquinone biosynthesis C-methylase UbiE n=1 Tax=Amycolatopsis cihanbeyliensis TaxID=1128664 RepID=A0A542DFN3_AMYCI|nr:class I SAM-dependent methyltransferase [Amycolatopsis cihanbeyliensis]TQJ01882.1 ubiquinone/menaquinone biosynthesis C-methylase UbiE [Amycolatopsis cihanbeyliensis]